MIGKTVKTLQIPGAEPGVEVVYQLIPHKQVRAFELRALRIQSDEALRVLKLRKEVDLPETYETPESMAEVEAFAWDLIVASVVGLRGVEGASESDPEQAHDSIGRLPMSVRIILAYQLLAGQHLKGPFRVAPPGAGVPTPQ